MAGKKRRRFGRVRRLPSGRWQARYRAPDGRIRPADRTFPTKTDAERWLALKEAEILQGDWMNPDAGKVLFGDYARAWIAERPNLRPKTLQLYDYLLRRHLLGEFEARPVGQITEPQVRRWQKARLDAGAAPVTVAKAYRLLRTMMNTAVDDGLLRRNPCRIKGAGQESSPERPVLTISQVYDLADACGPRYRALVLVATFCSLRWGELAALRRGDLGLDAGVVRVERQQTELRGGPVVYGPPKSAAGRRIVEIPSVIVPDLRWHLDRFVGPSAAALVFAGPKGGVPRHSNFGRRWRAATRAAKLPGVHLHDLRHTGNTYAAQAGATLRELMERMGHASTRAALIYLHTNRERQRQIADALSANVTRELKRARIAAAKASAEPRSGTQGARRRPATL